MKPDCWVARLASYPVENLFQRDVVSSEQLFDRSLSLWCFSHCWQLSVLIILFKHWIKQGRSIILKFSENGCIFIKGYSVSEWLDLFLSLSCSPALFLGCDTRPLKAGEVRALSRWCWRWECFCQNLLWLGYLQFWSWWARRLDDWLHVAVVVVRGDPWVLFRQVSVQHSWSGKDRGSWRYRLNIGSWLCCLNSGWS